MKTETQLGLLLRATPYLNTARILTLYTQKLGILSLHVRLSQKEPALTTPFCLAEWTYQIRLSELHTLREGKLLDPFSSLRSSFTLLSTAGKLAAALLRSQLPGKPSPLLFELTHLYFRALPSFSDPTTLLASYLLKILLHEGHLNLDQPTLSCWDWVVPLASSRSLTPLRAMTLPPQVLSQVEALFNASLV